MFSNILHSNQQKYNKNYKKRQKTERSELSRLIVKNNNKKMKLIAIANTFSSGKWAKDRFNASALLNMWSIYYIINNSLRAKMNLI